MFFLEEVRGPSLKLRTYCSYFFWVYLLIKLMSFFLCTVQIVQKHSKQSEQVWPPSARNQKTTLSTLLPWIVYAICYIASSGTANLTT